MRELHEDSNNGRARKMETYDMSISNVKYDKQSVINIKIRLAENDLSKVRVWKKSDIIR